MHLKSFIIGLVVLSIGGGMFWWVVSERKDQEKLALEYKQKYGSETTEYIKLYDEWMQKPADERAVLPEGLNLNANKSHEQVLEEQQERLFADMDKLAAGEMTTYPFAEEFYGQDWRDKVEEYKKEKEQMEFMYNISIAIAASGGLVVGLIILFNFARMLVKGLSKIKRALFSRTKKEADDSDIEDKEDSLEDENDAPVSEDKEEKKDEEHFKDISNVLVNSGWQYAGSFGNEQKPRLRQRKRIPAKNRVLNENENSENTKEDTGVNSVEEVENTKQKSMENEQKVTQDKAESETVIKNDIDVAKTKGNTHHIDSTLKDLTQQVSAIREYAANQQNRLERLQDGYDWNIIKTF